MRIKGHRSTRAGRLVGACAMVGALLAFPLAGAGQTATPRLKSYASQGTGYSLRMVVDLSGLPQPAKDAVQTAYTASGIVAESGGRLPASFPFVIDQRFIQTLADLGKANHGRAQLLTGLLSGEVVSADVTRMGTSDSSNTASKQLPDASLPLITATAGLLNAAITSVPKVTADGSIASVQTSLKSLLDAEILPAEVQGVLTQLEDAINAAVVSANTALDTALGQVAATYDSAAAAADPVLGPVLAQAGLQAVVTDATDLQAAVPAIPAMNDILGLVAANVTGLKNNALAEQSASKAFADAGTKIASVNLLGLLNVGALDLKSHSEAAGTPGSARNSSSCSLSTARLGSAGVSLDGKSLLVNGLPVPVPAVNVPAVKGAVDQVLGAAGLAVGLCEAAKPVAAKNGTSASQTVSALKITFAPALTALPETNTLGFAIGNTPVKIIIDPTVTTAASATVQPAVAAAPATPAPALPRTGPGSMPLILIGSIVAAGGLLFLLRHRLASLVGAR